MYIRSIIHALLMFSCTVGLVYAEPDYLQLSEVEYEVKADGKSKTLEIEVKVNGKIPVDGQSGAFGYAALTDGGNNVLVAVTHLPIDDSSFEKLPSGFHTHVLDLMSPTAACSNADFEVDLINSGNNKAFDANYDWSVKKHKIAIENVPVGDLGDAGVEAIAAFTLIPVLDEKNQPEHLCVHVASKL